MRGREIGPVDHVPDQVPLFGDIFRVTIFVHVDIETKCITNVLGGRQSMAD
jgi:hypothetical protein